MSFVSRILFVFSTSTVHLQWDADRYNDDLGASPTGRNAEIERKLAKDWPPHQPGKMTVVEKPAIILDRHGRILAWVVPDLFDQKRQASELLQRTFLSNGSCAE